MLWEHTGNGGASVQIAASTRTEEEGHSAAGGGVPGQGCGLASSGGDARGGHVEGVVGGCAEDHQGRRQEGNESLGRETHLDAFA